MKTRIFIYGLLFFSLIGVAYFIFMGKQVPIGLSTGKIKTYLIIKKNLHEGTLVRFSSNAKGFIFAGKTSNRITIIQTDHNGKKIFTIKEGLTDMNAMIGDVNLSTNPAGSKLCIVWTEKLDKAVKLYYKFYDLESGIPFGTVKVDEVNAVSYINLLYNDEYDEFAIFYIANDIPELVTIDSLGYGNPGKDLPFNKLTSEKIDMIWNGDEHVYALINHKAANKYRLIQFDSNGNLISDDNFTVDRGPLTIGKIPDPKKIGILYEPAKKMYKVLISQNNILYLITLDNQARVLNIKENLMPGDFNGEFDVIDNGTSCDVIYYSRLSKSVKKIIYTSRSDMIKSIKIDRDYKKYRDDFKDIFKKIEKDIERQIENIREGPVNIVITTQQSEEYFSLKDKQNEEIMAKIGAMKDLERKVEALSNGPANIAAKSTEEYPINISVGRKRVEEIITEIVANEIAAKMRAKEDLQRKKDLREGIEDEEEEEIIAEARVKEVLQRKKDLQKKNKAGKLPANTVTIKMKKESEAKKNKRLEKARAGSGTRR